MSIENLQIQKIKVIIVDDSAVIRNILSGILSEDNSIEIVESVSTAEAAYSIIGYKNIDIMLLDVEMPGISGIEAIPKLLNKRPNLKIIMVSSLTARNAPIAIQALSLGASDYIEKPSSRDFAGPSNFKQSLINKIKSLSKIYHNTLLLSQSNMIPTNANKDDIHLRQDLTLNFKPNLIAIASSTGGPKALIELVQSFDKNYLSKIPVLVTQHMPPIFTNLLAQNINKLGIIECVEGEDNALITAGKMYIAPGDKHMRVIEKLGNYYIHLTNEAPINFCRPAADPMFESILDAFKSNILAIMLTGMGHDGYLGIKKIVENKAGICIAQDKDTSVVWGMPGSVALNNLCSAVLPLSEIAQYVMKRGK